MSCLSGFRVAQGAVVFQALRPARGAPSYTLHLLRPYSMCPPPPLRESSGAGYRDYSPEPPPNSSLPPSHCSCHGPPQVSLLLDNGPSVARWDSDTSFSIRRQAYSSSEVTPPPTHTHLLNPQTDGTKKYTLISLEQLMRTNICQIICYHTAL